MSNCPKLIRDASSTPKCVAKPVKGILIALGFSVSVVMWPATIADGALSSSHTTLLCKVIRDGLSWILSMALRRVRRSPQAWLTSVATGTAAPAYWKSIWLTAFEFKEFNTNGAQPAVGTNPLQTPAAGNGLGRPPVASSRDAVRTLLTAKLPAQTKSP